MSNKEYKLWVDVAKGVGLLLVVIGHLWDGSAHPIVKQIIYSFHVPLFFILSGFVCDTDKYYRVYFIKKKIFSLLIPSVIYIIITLPLYFYYYSSVISFRRMIFFDGLVAYNDPVWFLIVLFEIMVMASLINTSRFNSIILTVMVVLSFTLSYVFYLKGITLIFGLNKAVLFFGFFVLGQLLKRFYDENEKGLPKQWLSLVAVVWTFIAVLNGKISFYNMDLNKYWLAIISGLTGSILVIEVIRALIEDGWKNKLQNAFVYLGKNSLFIVGTHYVYVDLVTTITTKRGFRGTLWYDLFIIVFVVAILIVYYPIIELLKAKIPLIVGKKEIG